MDFSVSVMVADNEFLVYLHLKLNCARHAGWAMNFSQSHVQCANGNLLYGVISESDASLPGLTSVQMFIAEYPHVDRMYNNHLPIAALAVHKTEYSL